MWKEVPGFEDKYWINENKEVKSKNKILKPNINHLGTYYYNLTDGSYRIKLNANKLVKELFEKNNEVIPVSRRGKQAYNILLEFRYINTGTDNMEIIHIVFLWYYKHQQRLNKLDDDELKRKLYAQFKKHAYIEKNNLPSNAEFRIGSSKQDHSKFFVQDVFEIVEDLNKSSRVLDKTKMLKSYIEGYNAKEIAELYSWNYGSVKSELRKVLDIIKEAFK